MAKPVFTTEEISLQDETDVTLRPLPIGTLKKFMTAWGHFSEVENDEEGFDVFINCCGIALGENFKGRFDSLWATAEEKKNGAFLSEQYKEYLESVLDLDTIYKVLEVCGQIKLNDPKLTEALEQLQVPEE